MNIWIGVGLLIVFVISVVARLNLQAQRLTRMELKLNVLLRHAGVNPTLPVTPSERVKQLAANPGTKIAAIKALREETGMGLAQAKEAVELLSFEKFHCPDTQAR